MTNHTKRNPLFSLTKNGNVTKKKSILVRIIAGILALVVCGIVSDALTGRGFLEFYNQLFEGTIGTERRIWNMIEEMAIVLIIAVAITPAFKMKFWNIGAEGQVLIGALACATVMFLWGTDIPQPFLYIVMFVFAIGAGAIWAVIPSIFKAFWNTNETLFTLMMNYIAICFVNYVISVWVPGGSGVVPGLPNGQLPVLFDQKYLFNILVVAITVIIVAIYLKKSKHGYELTVVGESINTARYIGINVKKVIIRTMVLSGVLCGLTGFLIVAGSAHNISSSVVGGRGFTAILVSWLAGFNPLNMIITAFLVAFIFRGANQMSTVSQLGSSFPNIITGIFFFFIIASEFFVNYRIHFHNPFKTKGEDKKPLIKEVE